MSISPEPSRPWDSTTLAGSVAGVLVERNSTTNCGRSARTRLRWPLPLPHYPCHLPTPLNSTPALLKQRTVQAFMRRGRGHPRSWTRSRPPDSAGCGLTRSPGSARMYVAEVVV
ncbi:Uncharacterised protein [Mycobacteroides abscessus subsp. abscessus]|nr:Uncharacterised protein [Mycobacteroides abscessus subsp. abscessus]